MRIFMCNDCGWIGSDNEAFTLLNFDEHLICPTCGSDSNIEQYIDYNMDDFTNEQVKKLWELFTDIEIGLSDDFIREEFFGFRNGPIASRSGSGLNSTIPKACTALHIMEENDDKRKKHGDLPPPAERRTAQGNRN